MHCTMVTTAYKSSDIILMVFQASQPIKEQITARTIYDVTTSQTNLAFFVYPQ